MLRASIGAVPVSVMRLRSVLKSAPPFSVMAKFAGMFVVINPSR